MGSRYDQLREMRESKFVTRPVTKPAAVTKAVTCPNCLLLEAEVKQLKRLLADSGKAPMTGAERVRKHRAAKRNAGSDD